MKPIPEALESRLKDTPSTLCNCWILRRKDGEIFGFTDHDRELIVDTVSCEPESGMIAGALEQSTGLAGDTSPAEGALTSDRITEADIHAGLYDGATIDRYCVDWRQPELNVKLGRSILGEVTLNDGAFSVEMRSAASLLERNRTRHFSRFCDAEFGDVRCGMNVDQPALSKAVTVESVENGTVILSLDEVIQAQDFVLGRLVLQASAQEIKLQVRQIRCLGGLRYNLDVFGDGLSKLAAGQTGQLIAGCDKAFATCRDRFGNAERFRGFPHIPSAEKALNYVDDEGVFDGSPIVV